MGLKGKIEAIIYAAEEPVSLDQIALLVKEPALQDLAEERARTESAQAAASEQQENGTPAEAGGDASSEAAVISTDSVTIQDQPSEPEPQPGQMVPEPGAQAETSQDVALEKAENVEAKRRPDAVEFSAEGGSTPDNQSSAEVASAGSDADSSTAEPNSVAVPSEQTLAEASEKAKSSVASKRRAKPEIPPEVKSKVRATLEELIADYTNPDRGMEIRQIAGGYRMTTKPEHHDVVKAFAKSLKPPLRLSLPALETLAVIAYKQPVTAPEVGEIRGVDSQGVVATLLDRKLITTAGRKAVIGRPILYKTTKEFLMRFGLNEISELPSMEEFEKLALEAGQVDMFNTEEENAPATPAGATEDATVQAEEELISDGTDGAAPDLPASEKAVEAEHGQPEQPEQAVTTDSHPEDSASTAQIEPANSEEPVD